MRQVSAPSAYDKYISPDCRFLKADNKRYKDQAIDQSLGVDVATSVPFAKHVNNFARRAVKDNHVTFPLAGTSYQSGFADQNKVKEWSFKKPKGFAK